MEDAERPTRHPGILYVDTSALLKLLVREAESEVIEVELLRWERLATSVVTEVELPRAVSRAREDRADAVIDGSVVLQGILAASAIMPLPHLTVSEVAAELGITTSGVYKLIGRGKLPAIRRSERGMRISPFALAAYKRRVQGEDLDDPPITYVTSTLEESRAAFEQETKLSPAEWERRWKDEQFEDSAENMGLAIRALGLLLREQNERQSSEPRRHAPSRSAA